MARVTCAPVPGNREAADRDAGTALGCDPVHPVMPGSHLAGRALPARHAASVWQPVGLALGTASALGLGRFAYGLLVPAMRSELHWSLAQAGALTTANGLGYLLGGRGCPG